MLSRLGRCLASGPCLLPPDCDDLLASFPRSGSRCLASLRAGSCLTTPARDGRVLAQVSPHSIIIITEYLRWLVSTRLRQLASSIYTNQLWKSNGSIIWIKWILPFLWLQLFNMPLKIDCCKSFIFYYWFMLYPEENSKVITCCASPNLHVSILIQRNYVLCQIPIHNKPRDSCLW